MYIMPCVIVTSIEKRAVLCLVKVIRLSWMPVGVSHQRHCIAEHVGSPDERRFAVRVYTMTSRPEMRTSSQYCL